MAEGLGILGGYNEQYDAATKQQGDIARYKGLQALSQMMQMPQGGGSPMGGGQPGMPPMGGPPMGGPPMGGMPPGGGMPRGGGMPPPGGGGMPPGGGGMPPGGGGMPPGGGGMPPGGFGQPGQGPLSLPMVIQAIQKSNPGAPPNVLAAAIDGMLPLMNMQSQQMWREQRMMLQEGNLREREAHDVAMETEAGKRTEQAGERIKQGDEKLKQGETRLRLSQARLEWQKDKGLQELDIKRQALEERVKSGKDKTAISQWRAIVDAQHKRMMEIIQQHSVNVEMTAEEKATLRKEADAMRNEAIKGIRGATIDRDAAKKAGYSDEEIDAFEKGK